MIFVLERKIYLLSLHDSSPCSTAPILCCGVDRQMIHRISSLPESHRTPEQLSRYSSMVFTLINTITYIRLYRIAGYRYCNPHELGYTAAGDYKNPVIADLIGKTGSSFLWLEL